MLTRFSVKNYRNFTESITLDLTKVGSYDFNQDLIKNGVINKGLIYGDNGSGKSNLCYALFDITDHLSWNCTLPKSLQCNYRDYPRTSSVDDNTYKEFTYEFEFSGKKVLYTYKKDSVGRLLEEHLIIDSEEVLRCDFLNREYFSTLKGAENAGSLISWENRRVASIMGWDIMQHLSTYDFVDESDPNYDAFTSFLSFINGMRLFSQVPGKSYPEYTCRDSFKYIVGKGELNDFEQFLHRCGVEYQIKEGADGKSYELNASDGMKVLASFYAAYLRMLDENEEIFFAVIDDFGSLCSTRASGEMLELLKKVDSVQTILVSHNTDLISNDYLRPDCYFILRNNSIENFDRLTDKDIRFAHNLQKMYKANFS